MRLLPYAHKRPIALVRCPQGDAQQCFFQKHKLPGLGDEVKKARIAGNEVIYVENESGILELVQFNAIEIHGWGATISAPDKPDWIVIDLDPDTALEILTSGKYADEVRAREQFYQQNGISSVPAIIINERHLISGGQPPEVFEQALRQIIAQG